MAKELVAMLLAGGQGSRLYALTQKLAKPAVPFGGKYRIIDFPLSNCVNSGIDTVGILTQYQPFVLNEYIGNGQYWELDRLYGGVHVLPPYQKASVSYWYKGTANAIYQNIAFIERYDPQYVIILSVDQLNFSYSENKIFDNLSFSIQNKSINCVIGSNNCGKTTLIKILSGILQSHGEITLSEVNLNKKNIKKYSLMIGFIIFSLKNKFVCDKVIDEIVFPLENLCFSKKEIKTKLNEISELFEIKEILKKKINDLSNYEQVKIELASLLIYNPKIVFLDDIFEGLTFKEYNDIINIIKEAIDKYDVSIVYTTNKLENAILSDKIIFINNKKVDLEGSVNEILKHDNYLLKSGINIPKMIDLSLKLNFYNLLDEVIMDTDRMVDTLWR